FPLRFSKGRPAGTSPMNMYFLVGDGSPGAIRPATSTTTLPTGTARVVTNASGTVLDDSDFYPFGGERPYLSSSGNPYKFTGKERDSESGLDNFGARYMGSNLGRFMSPDPKHVNAHLSDPQSFTRCTYARNNPLLYVDPDGRDFEKAMQDL